MFSRKEVLFWNDLISFFMSALFRLWRRLGDWVSCNSQLKWFHVKWATQFRNPPPVWTLMLPIPLRESQPKHLHAALWRAEWKCWQIVTQAFSLQENILKIPTLKTQARKSIFSEFSPVSLAVEARCLRVLLCNRGWKIAFMWNYLLFFVSCVWRCSQNNSPSLCLFSTISVFAGLDGGVSFSLRSREAS